ncbi:MAG: hypothetical protein JWM52_122 [Candidatus Saccharibacteria bacterium]|nr:hypothetical protein [Candidatus Saccharibacteria bacterium]
MIQKQTIAIDIDDVITDTTEALRIWGNELSGVEISRDEFKTPGEYWGYTEGVWKRNNVEHLVSYDTFEDLLASGKTYVPLLSGASFAIQELQKKYHIILITARSPWLEKITKEWLAKEFPHSDIELFLAQSMDRRANLVGKTKGELCKELGVSYLIDDNIGHCQSALEEGVDVVLFGEYGWQTDAPEDITRCRSWPEVLEYFDGR